MQTLSCKCQASLDSVLCATERLVCEVFVNLSKAQDVVPPEKSGRESLGEDSESKDLPLLSVQRLSQISMSGVDIQLYVGVLEILNPFIST